MHAVDNFLATVESICQRRPESFFPTVFPGQDVIESVKGTMQVPNDTNRTLIGIVPGVGRLRPHRAWPPSHWIALLQRLDRGKYWPVLIGGAEEVELCDKISDGLSGQCTNLAGQLSLLQTAACLKQCAFVISGDTGPAHVAVAVGTKVVGIYGPTFAQRSGPFGCSTSTIDRSGQCYCIEAKNCRVVSPGQPSNCLSEIYVEEVEEKMGAVAQNRGNMVS